MFKLSLVISPQVFLPFSLSLSPSLKISQCCSCMHSCLFSSFKKKNSNLKAFNQIANEIQKKRMEYKFSRFDVIKWLNQPTKKRPVKEAGISIFLIHFRSVHVIICICKCAHRSNRHHWSHFHFIYIFSAPLHKHASNPSFQWN